MKARTGGERYLAGRMSDPEYARAYRDAARSIEVVDNVIQTLDHRRQELKLSKAELARRAGLRPEAVRRLFASGGPNPTVRTLAVLAGALDLEWSMRPAGRGIKRGPSGGAQ